MSELLNRDELEIIKKCENGDYLNCLDCPFRDTKKCFNSTLVDTAFQLYDKVDKMQSILKRLEFSKVVYDGESSYECFICGGEGEHTEDCELGILLKEEI